MFLRNLPNSPDWVWIVGLLVASIAALGWVEVAPQVSGNVAVVFPPWVSAGEVVRRTTAAGATIIKSGGFYFVLIVHPTSPAFAERAITDGALLVLDANTVSGCGSAGSQSR